ncbi:replication initiator protein [robinz microvirus RP_38]|nr:replication initiator protein [robinz microvirus RP_38]
MSCLMPIPCWKGAKNENHRRPLVFSHKRDHSYEDDKLEIPCGKCLGCQGDKARAWAIRIYHEVTTNHQNCFITLTYDDEHMPEDGKISQEHYREFFKNLKAETGLKLRYFACGEYGEKTRRPHYHAIIFGADFLGGHYYRINDELYGNSLVDRVWGKGQVTIAPAETGSCFYVAGYVQKKVLDQDTFRLMTTKPAIGRNWLDKNIDDLIECGHVVIEGRKMAIPPAYLKMYEEDLQEVKEKRAHMMRSITPQKKWEHRQKASARLINLQAQLNQKAEKL